MKKYRVLHVMSGYGGGVSSHVRNIINGMDPSKVVIDVAGFTDYPDFFVKEVQAKEGQVFRLKNVRLKCLAECTKEYTCIVREGHYDAVHLHITDVPEMYFSLLSRFAGIKRIIVHAHISSRPDADKPLSKIKYSFFRWLTVLMATDLASCSKLASTFRYGKKYVRENKIMHIPNSIDAERYGIPLSAEQYRALMEELDIPTASTVIGNVGYFGYQKNHPFMLKLIKRMKERKIPFVWIFIGIGPDFEKIKNDAEKMNISDSIRFLGRRNDVDRLYQFMDVSVLPSHYEGLPTVTIETQAAGTPTVISDTITDETDMRMGLVDRLSLDDSLDSWIDTIMAAAQKKKPNAQERIAQIEKMFFTAPTAANLYAAFIAGKIKYYNLGDGIELHI